MNAGHSEQLSDCWSSEAQPVVLREPPRRRRSLRLLRRRACDHAARLHRAEIAGEAMPLRYGNDRRCCERRGWLRGTESSQTHRWRWQSRANSSRKRPFLDCGVRTGVERPVNYLLKEKAGSTMLELKTF